MPPLVVISYNNHFYLKNTLAQAEKYGLDVIVVDNGSPFEDTRTYLKEIETTVKVIYLPTNFGYGCWKLPEVYDDLPERFLLTDPDLQWNPRLPLDFPAALDDLCSQFTAGKVGFALDISDGADMFLDTDYYEWKAIPDWESQMWIRRMPHPLYELYDAGIDTMFQLFNKAAPCNRQIRVAGDFTCKHLPWYRDSPVPIHDLVHMYFESKHSTISKLVIREMVRKQVRWEPCDGCRNWVLPEKV